MADAYVQLLRAQVRSQTQYRLSFAVDLALNAGITVIDVLVLLAVFRVTPSLAGFGVTETLLIAGIAQLAFQLADVAVGNLERVPFYLRTGLLDAVLLRPLSTFGQLVVLDFSLRRAGRVVQGLATYGVALAVADVDWTVPRVLLAAVAPFAGAVCYGAIFTAGAATMFWLVDGGEVVNVFTYGGRDFASYPTPVYGPWFGRVFGFVIGLAFVGYFPALALLGLSDPLGTPAWLHWCGPAVSLVWAAVARVVWRVGVRHYQSTGS
ncbi:ABC transporter permease [Cryptosporangium aurantiacum]|uniref:ABC-2 type transport system permease protein n=1 Tax=Cryptosporangium aurantiacum TaxID=134849 RepID=A0A1M7R7P5_9ACTN|nr:ABC-2 family transporter protein [Cryptosporangium aurantiacum]SHN42327.1 ABC-2 type transport system permease protein [Cryptosporangium aurantiacum]